MNLWKRFIRWMNRPPICSCGREMVRYEGLGAGFWYCDLDGKSKLP